MIARRIIVALLERIESGQLTLVEDGRRRVFGSGSPQATVIVHDAAVWPALLRGGRGLAQGPTSTASGTRRTSPPVIEVAARNLRGIDELRRQILATAAPRGGATTPRRARDDISAHYDLGNELFELMLDPTMMLLGRDLRAARDDARGGLAGQARAHLRQARPRAVRPRARDRHRLGRLCAARGGHPRLPRHHDHVVARAARPGAPNACVRPASRTASRSCCRTTASSPASTTKLASIEMIEAVGWKGLRDVLRPLARGCSPPTG